MSVAPPGRIAVVLSHPIQYYGPWFRHLAASGWNLRVFYLWDFGVTRQHDAGFGQVLAWDIDLLSGYEHEFVPNVSRDPGTHHLRGLDNPDLFRRLQAWRPDAILVFGYKYLTHLRLLAMPPAPLVFRGDSHLLDAPLRPLKRVLLTAIYSRFASVTYVGWSNRGYFRALGVPPANLFFAPHCVDSARFTADESLRAQAAALKASLGLTGQRIVLFAGKLIAKKQPGPLLEAFLETETTGAALVFVGAGEELEPLRTLAATRPDKTVRFLPFANQSRMPVHYLIADVFALPSRGPEESWGLAVNEAMHLGVPCLVSDRVGCQRDLVTEGETGWVFSITRPGSLRDALTRALDATARDPAGFRRRVSERIAAYTYASASAGLSLAVRHATARNTRVL